MTTIQERKIIRKTIKLRKQQILELRKLEIPLKDNITIAERVLKGELPANYLIIHSRHVNKFLKELKGD